MLELNGIHTKYGKIPMLDNASLNVKQGEIVCLLGANGAGKTTLLKTIIGLVPALQGTIFYKGNQINKWPSHRIIEAGIAIVPQGGGVFPKMAVETNLRLGAYFEKEKTKIENLLKDCYKMFPRLDERKNQKAGTLSGGERTMLAIARALMAEPQLLLLDEPSLGLAPVLVQETFANIKNISERKRIPILLVEQNADKALALANRGYVMQKGRIVAAGTKEELMESSFVKESYLLA